jgi:PAS domain-containing protein
MKYMKYILTLFSLTVIYPNILTSMPAVETASEKDKYILGNYLETLEDREGTLTINEVSSNAFNNRFKPNHKQIPNFGFTASAYWTRMNIVNKSETKQNWLLEVGFPLLDKVILYAPDNALKSKRLIKWNAVETGRLIPFNQHDFIHRNFIFNINLPEKSETPLFIRIETKDGMIFPMTLWKPEKFRTYMQMEQFIFGLYYGIVIVMVFYNLFLFISIRDKNYLFYILYITSFGSFQLAMNGLAYQYLWPSSPWWAIHANPFFIGLSMIFAVSFTMNFLNTKNIMPAMNKIFIVLLVLSVLLAFSSLAVSYSITIIAGQILPLIAIFITIPTAVLSLLRGNKSARFYLMAWSAFFVGVILSTFRVMGIIDHNLITEHGLQIGSGVEMVLLSFALADRINILKAEKENAQILLIEAQKREFESLKKAKQEVDEANIRITLSEEKYRLLVEGTADIIFSLDENYRFITVNKAIEEVLGIKPDPIKSKSFFDIIYESNDAPVSRQAVREKFEQLMSTKNPVEFRVGLISPSILEPQEMQIRLEYLNIEGKNEILGKASSIISDELMTGLQYERQKYVIGNYLHMAEAMAQRLTAALKKHMKPGELNLIRIGLEEIILNAIEHGNLDISFKDKTESISNDRYFEMINRRRDDPAFRNRKITIEYSLDEHRAEYIITDDGDGFDHGSIIKDKSKASNVELLGHGRGVNMAYRIFDEMRYNKKGNQVFLVKKLTKK